MTGHNITPSSDRPSMTDLQSWAISADIRDPLLWPEGNPSNKGFRKANYTRLLKAHRKAHPQPERTPGKGAAISLTNRRQREALAKDASGQVRPVEEVSLPQWTTGMGD
jgi:hypothetical protein